MQQIFSVRLNELHQIELTQLSKATLRSRSSVIRWLIHREAAKLGLTESSDTEQKNSEALNEFERLPQTTKEL